jgi:hypothetical protein
MRNWQKLIKSACSSQGLSKASTVAVAVYDAMTATERKATLIELLTEQAEGQIRENVRTVERRAERSSVFEKSKQYREMLENRHGRTFESLKEANDFDDDAWKAIVQDKREEQDRRRAKVFSELTERLHMQWTDELLSKDFAVGDGSIVTWADATIEQHEARVEMLFVNVQGNGDAIRRHEAAVIDILENRVSTLAEAFSR